MKKIAALTLTTALVSSLTFSSAFAFTDVEEGQSAAISALQERGIVSGIDKDHFVPKERLVMLKPFK